ncbi:MAG: substrate-binding domain-containing protein, partial [Candidatus Hydrogenedentes bacterium]|nr:substrate-binding domain-containing protein [Candidatus Hydrogenedentota bacterium]
KSSFNKYGLKAGFDAVMDLRSSNPEFTALFLMGDQAAIGSLHALHQLGLSVPDQVSLLTCDDAPEIQYLDPPLTVMDIPNRKFGYTAAQRVHHMITNDSTQAPSAQESWMRGELIIRASTAPPRK